MARISLIAAIASNRALGKDNNLLWHISEDLRHFKETTTGCVVIMGRLTYESMGRLLPKRTNVIVTRNADYAVEGAVMVHSLDEAFEKFTSEEEIFVIGGGEIYKASLPLADRVYLTEVQKEYDADTFFPELDPTVWRESSRVHNERGEKFEYPFDFVVYDRIR